MSANKSKQRKEKLKARKNKKAAGARARWLPFAQRDVRELIASKPEADRAMAEKAFAGARVFVNNIYSVIARPVQTGFGHMMQLSVERLDQEPARDWRELQRIKNELLGPEGEAVELYPAESRLVDCNNVTYLYCLMHAADADGKPQRDADGNWVFAHFPFGYPTRLVSEDVPAGKKQRRWRKDERPADLTTLKPEDIREAFAKHEAAEKAAKEALAASTPTSPLDTLPGGDERASALDAILNAPEEVRNSKEFCNARARFLELMGYVDKMTEENNPAEAAELRSIQKETLRLFDGLTALSKPKGEEGGSPVSDPGPDPGPDAAPAFHKRCEESAGDAAAPAGNAGEGGSES